MTKQIDIANRKGGTGKSEVAIHLSVYLSQYKNKKVLLLDQDSSNCSISVQLIKMDNDPVIIDNEEGHRPLPHSDFTDDENKWDGISSIASIFYDEPVIPYNTKINNLDILPGYTSKQLLLQKTHRNLVEKNIYEKFISWKTKLALENKYDYLIIDHAPVKTNIGDASLNVSDGLVIPVQAKSSDLNGMKRLLQLWAQINQARTIDNPLHLLAIIISNYDKRRSVEELVKNDIENNAVASKYLAPEVIDASKFILEKSSERHFTKMGTVFDFPDSNTIKQKMIAVCEHIFRGLN